MWNVKTKVIPVTIRATGTISKSFTKYLLNVLAKYEIIKTTKNSHIDCCTFTAESADVKVRDVQHGK
jgi:hypothetical protein